MITILGEFDQFRQKFSYKGMKYIFFWINNAELGAEIAIFCENVFKTTALAQSGKYRSHW
jgi:hypothetical protein